MLLLQLFSSAVRPKKPKIEFWCNCELNNVTHEGHEGDLIEEENYFYHAAEVTAI